MCSISAHFVTSNRTPFYIKNWRGLVSFIFLSRETCLCVSHSLGWKSVGPLVGLRWASWLSRQIRNMCIRNVSKYFKGSIICHIKRKIKIRNELKLFENVSSQANHLTFQSRYFVISCKQYRLPHEKTATKQWLILTIMIFHIFITMWSGDWDEKLFFLCLCLSVCLSVSLSLSLSLSLFKTRSLHRPKMLPLDFVKNHE